TRGEEHRSGEVPPRGQPPGAACIGAPMSAPTALQLLNRCLAARRPEPLRNPPRTELRLTLHHWPRDYVEPEHDARRSEPGGGSPLLACEIALVATVIAAHA